MAEIAGQVGVRMFMDAGEFVRSSKKAEAEARRLTVSLERQADVIKFGAERAQLADLDERGASPESIAKMAAAQDRFNAAQADQAATAAKAAKDQQLINNAMREADAIQRSMEKSRASAFAEGRRGFQSYIAGLEEYRGATVRASMATGTESGTGFFGQLAGIGRLVRGGGALIGIKLITTTIENNARAIEEASAKYKDGTGSLTDMQTAFMSTIPIVGDLTNAINSSVNAIQNFIDARERMLRGPERRAGQKRGEIAAQNVHGDEAADKILKDSSRDLMTQWDRDRAAAKDIFDERESIAIDALAKLAGLGVKSNDTTRRIEEARIKAQEAYNQRMADIYNDEQKSNKDRWAQDAKDREKAIGETLDFSEQMQFDLLRLREQYMDSAAEQRKLAEQEAAEEAAAVNAEFEMIKDEAVRLSSESERRAEMARGASPELAQFGSAAAIRIANRSMSGGGNVENQQLGELKKIERHFNSGIRVKSSDLGIANF